jgi:plasmid stabilization system protein ParE
MRIEFTTPALRDLEELRTYLSARSGSGLANVLGDIESTVIDIPKSISRGRKTPRDDVWERVSSRYKFVIPYHVQSGAVYILRIYHPKREPLDYDNLKL